MIPTHALFSSLLLVALLLWQPSSAIAHRIQQARIIHIVVHGQKVELYVNLLLPRTPKTRLWIALFDRNRDHRLNDTEQRALGAYLKRFVLPQIQLFHQKQRVTFHFKELQNSRLRGDPRRRRYSWDYRLQATLPALKPGVHHFSLRLHRLFARERIPIAWIATGRDQLRKTRSSYVLRRSHGDRAICNISAQKHHCQFVLVRPPPPSTSRPRPIIKRNH